MLPKQEVLKQLQGTIEEESGEASGSQLELIERLKGERETSEKLRGDGNKLALSVTQTVLSHPPEMSLESAGFKSRPRLPQPPSSSSSSASVAPGGAAGGVFPRRGLPPAGRDGHDRCLEELEKERYSSRQWRGPLHGVVFFLFLFF